MGFLKFSRHLYESKKMQCEYFTKKYFEFKIFFIQFLMTFNLCLNSTHPVINYTPIFINKAQFKSNFCADLQYGCQFSDNPYFIFNNFRFVC